MDKYAKKWEQILQMSNIDTKYWGRVGYYCERYSERQNGSMDINGLTISLRVLGKIDLSKVIFTDTQSICYEIKISVKMTTEQIFELNLQPGIDVVSMTESMLAEEMVMYINRIIKTTGGVVIYDLCKKVGVVQDNIILESYCLPLDIYRGKKLTKLINIINEKI